MEDNINIIIALLIALEATIFIGVFHLIKIAFYAQQAANELRKLNGLKELKL